MIAVTFLILTISNAVGQNQLLDTPSLLKGLRVPVNDDIFSTLSKVRLHHIYESKSSVFPYFDSTISEKYSNFPAEYEFVDGIVKDICSNTDGKYRYYSGNLFQSELNSIHSMLNPTNMFRAQFADKISTNVWIGGEGVKAPTHYDNANNVYIQLSGSKRFRLAPPRRAYDLLLHGRHHPYSCQSRFEDLLTGTRFNRQDFDILHELREKYELIRNNDCEVSSSNSTAFAENIVEVTLHPGDVLFIPAFWFHEVTALTCSVSVSYWWDSSVLDIMDNVYGLPLPIESDWSSNKKVAAIFLFLDALIAGLDHQVHFQNGQEANSVPSSLSVLDLLMKRYLFDREQFLQILAENKAGVVLRTLRGYSDNIKDLQNENPNGKVTQRIEDLLRELFLPLFAEFMKQPPIDLTSIMKDSSSFTSERLYENGDRDCDGSGDVCVAEDKVWLNGVAVRNMKAADYIEDVLLFVVSMSEDISAPLAEAVLLLLEYLQFVDKKTHKL